MVRVGRRPAGDQAEYLAYLPGDGSATTDLSKTRGGRFVLREANNLAPETPLENLAAMCEAAKSFGRYADSYAD